MVSPEQKRIWGFLILTFALASPSYYLIISAGTLSVDNGQWVSVLMWAPGLAALVTCLVFQHNLKGLGWYFGKVKYLIFGYFIPVIAGFIIYSSIWMTHLGEFSSERFVNQLSSSSFIYALLYMSIVGVFWYSGMTALGEELGWRGFLAPRLMGIAGYTKTALISSVIWSFYHYPILLFSDYHSAAPTWYAFIMFTANIIAISFIAVWLRIKSASVWPPVLLHASHNLFIGHVYETLTIDTPITEYFATEFGAGLVVIYSVIAWFCWKNRNSLRYDSDA